LTTEQLYKIYLQYPDIEIDTRKLKEGAIFFALKGPNFNGNTFAQKALEAGAAYAVIDEAEHATNDRCILVDDVLTTLQKLANYHRRQFSIPFIAIAGSNGKTTTKELIYAVLSKRYKAYATEGNLNNHIGVPLTILRIRKDAEIAIIEMGANHQKEIESYCVIAMPTHGIITNAGKAHIEGFGSEEGVKKGKGELFDYLRAHNGVVFRNSDLDYLDHMAKGIEQQVTYGEHNGDCVGSPAMQDVFLNVNLEKPEAALIPTQLVGAYNFPNAMTAICIGFHFGVSIGDIKAALATYAPDNSRSQWVQKGSNKIILDAYNANPTSMRAAIGNFAKTALNNKLLWIGAMKEMGKDEHKEHAELVNYIKQYPWSDVILVGKEFDSVETDYRKFDTSAAAAAYIATNHPESAAILIKGSRGSKMEVLLNALKQ
jgi:UDP-N-acetylmuramoyl-tripeptide--D-alanyl-D-alanine ligase